MNMSAHTCTQTLKQATGGSPVTLQLAASLSFVKFTLLLQEEMARLQQEIEILKAERAPGEKVKASLCPLRLQLRFGWCVEGLQQFGGSYCSDMKKRPFTPEREGTARPKEGL